jgi:hypothetical protein
VVNDDVMGGRSEGRVHVEDGRLVFRGATNTDGGGFSSARLPLDAADPDAFDPDAFDLDAFDFGACDGLAVRVRGDGRGYELDVRTGERVRGMKVAYRAPLDAPAGAWHVARVPFDAFRASARGRALDRRLPPAALRAVGFFLYDGADGPFRLEVDWIAAF